MYIGSITDQHISIAALQRRTGNDAVPARTTHLINPGRDRAKPGPAILVGQRNTLMHLVDIGWGVKPIGILELQCKRWASNAPTVDLPLPETPMRTITDARGDILFSLMTHPHCSAHSAD